MISENGANGKKRPLWVALEDAVVVFLAGFFTSLVATGLEFPPSGSILYAAFVVSALSGVMSWAKARGVHVEATGG
jgi:hypothetical protein